jgi:exosortase
MPCGAAGCIKNCEDRLQSDCVLVMGGSVWLEDDPGWMLAKHRESGNAITVFCAGPSRRLSDGNLELRPSGVFVINRSVLRLIPKGSYFDLKEQLIPAARNAGLAVGAVRLPGHSQIVVDWDSYLEVLERSLTNVSSPNVREIAPGIWCGEGVSIAPTARVVGPVLFGDGCAIDAQSLVIGPAVFADDTKVGQAACLVRVVTARNSLIRPGTHLTDRFIHSSEPSWDEHSPQVTDSTRSARIAGGERVNKAQTHDAPVLDTRGSGSTPSRSAVISGGAALLAMFLWAFWHTISDLVGLYQRNADASIGGLAPLAAGYMLWVSRGRVALRDWVWSPSGMVLFALGFLFNLTGSYYLFSSLSNLGLVMSLNGLALAFLGWRNYKQVWYPLVFLILLCPIPGKIQDLVMLPLQTFGSILAAGVLEMGGIAVERAGHVFDIGGQTIAVAEACNGLRMVTSAFLVSGVLAFLVHRPRWQRTALVLSSIPIALICNVGRIALTASLHAAGRHELAEGLFHDVTGLLMMPIMLVLMLLELWVFRWFEKLCGPENRLAEYSVRLKGPTYVGASG